MLPSRQGVTSARGRGAKKPQAGNPSRKVVEERRQGFGVQESLDGSKYEGEFVNGFKHGKGRYTWKSGEFYEGSFYKDYRHGDGVYCWPSGHKFIGKFYLNWREGYGQLLFPDGAIFKGLYHADQRFGPGVLSEPSGRQDVGLWHGKHLIQLCNSVQDSFSLKNVYGYADYLAQTCASYCQRQPKKDDSLLLHDGNAILPSGIEHYSTDSDHLQFPPEKRREFDQHFYGQLWEPDDHPYEDYKRDPLATLPLKTRILAHIHKHRRLTENLDWDIAAILSLKRDSFGPKGPLEVTSELLIRQAAKGERQSVLKILLDGLVHPDVEDSLGHTALIAATVNSHHDVIHLLLDMGADIDKLNYEGLSALSVCHVLYYPFESLYMFSGPPAKAQVCHPDLLSLCSNNPLTSPLDFTIDSSSPNNRPQTSGTLQTNQDHLSDQTTEDLSGGVWFHPNTCSALSTDLSAPETPEEYHFEEKDKEDKVETGQQRKWKDACNVANYAEREIKSRSKDAELGGIVIMNIFNEGESWEEDDKKNKEEKVLLSKHSIPVMDGHIVLGSVEWQEYSSVKHNTDKDLTPAQSFASTCAMYSYNIQVTEEDLQTAAETLSHTGFSQHCDTQETVRRMAAMKFEHRVRLSTLKLLLDRGADPNISSVPLPVMFLAIMAADTETVKKLLLCDARTDISLPPEWKGFYPLHVAAALPGPEGPKITELLLHALSDPDARAGDHDGIYLPDKVSMKTKKSWRAEKPSDADAMPCTQDELCQPDKKVSMITNKSLRTSQKPCPLEGGLTALHMACQRDTDHCNASKVVSLLLSHRAKTDLLWSGHSPLSLAISSGNDMAVAELLKAGADPNLPLGRGVGNALCALSNFNYRLDGKRAKLLDMLEKAGADMLTPVQVGDSIGNVVDYAHNSFNQDLRIASTPFHALNMEERETFKARRNFLSMMGDLLRQTAVQREKESNLLLNRAISSNVKSSNQSERSMAVKQRTPLFNFCYHCGRSIIVRLTACTRCHKVFYCSTTCKLKAWDKKHKEECL
ncbi:ankyrin repeat and MYND domain-containing protein 1-like isoform X2 [Dunckerocampus dactyliophorus]|uniref:ankyrin repeat and MYND domain-containing protein 1-like isoform X2 n=1 Tax=Dunckerocampus dactyliophorus TaxID=161453 RepID=UPI0024069067|nr:ankyrin repeat and MYND domain-containing protein 1-like isoform X2 [Dunckerocampus dactyliophorus]